MIGQTVSHYKILEKLGEGGMGVVYKAEDLKLKRVVAIKFLPKRLSVHGEERERFIHEAQAASALNHPNICIIHEIDEVNDESFIVMEYMDGVTLREWIRKKAEQPEGYRKLGIKEAVDLAAQIAEGLEKAHEKGIVHRDVKSENIMVTTDGRAKIMDFGLAKLKGVSKLTKTGSTVGTIAYMSPEQVEGIETDHRTDIFSFGVVIYEMLAGHLPFRAEHETAMMYEIINVEPESLADQHKGIDSELNRIVMKCLEKDREERYQSMREVAVDLKRYKRDSEGKRIERKTGGSEMPQLFTPASSSERSKTNWLKIGLASFGAILIIGLGIYLFTTKTTSIDSIAVLPFVNVNGDSTTEYLSDGITGDIINSLSQVPTLRVIPRSTVVRYKGKDLSAEEIGNQLRVRAVLSGSIVQRGDDVSIQVELDDLTRQAQVWGQRYDRKAADLLSLHEEITMSLLSRLQPDLAREKQEQISKRPTENAQAYEFYLKGQYLTSHWVPDEVKKGLDYLQRAVELDPGFALGYAGLGKGYYDGAGEIFSHREGMPKAREALQKALELDDNLQEAHLYLGVVKANFDWDWKGAEEEFKLALKLNPNYAEAHAWQADYLCYSRQKLDDALVEAKKAIELDPRSFLAYFEAATILRIMKRYDDALKLYQNMIEIDINPALAEQGQSFTYALEGRYDQALALLERNGEKYGRMNRNLYVLSWVYASMGKKAEARQILAELKSREKTQYVRPLFLVKTYIALGDTAGAFEALQKAYEERDEVLVTINEDPMFDPIRSDPRFKDIVRKVGLPE